MYDTLLLESHGPVLLIRLNRPEALNALNQQLMTDLAAAVTAADANPAVRCIVLTGSDKAFAAGADMQRNAGQDLCRCPQHRHVWP